MNNEEVEIDKEISAQVGIQVITQHLTRMGTKETPSVLHGLLCGVIILLQIHGLEKDQILDFIEKSWIGTTLVRQKIETNLHKMH